jgi:hypothetical protein
MLVYTYSYRKRRDRPACKKIAVSIILIHLTEKEKKPLGMNVDPLLFDHAGVTIAWETGKDSVMNY